MKPFKTLLLTVFVLFSFAACNNNEPETDPEVKIENGTYMGLLSVDQNTGSVYTQDSVCVKVEINENKTLNLVMEKVKFSQYMPVTLDMTIPKVTTETINNSLVLSGDSIIPIAMGGEFSKYTITEITGTLTNEKLEMTMMCGVYPLSFSGTKNISN